MATIKWGPGAMVAAAFIGPGTVTTATAAGAQFGLGLLWAVAFSVVATLVLQELALRTALVTQRDLSPLITGLGVNHWWRRLLVALIVVAIGVGNSAYQSGNLLGAALGLQSGFAGSLSIAVLLCAAIAAVLIWLDRYALLERVLVTLVGLMVLLFLGVLLLLAPQLTEVPAAEWRPALPGSSVTIALALIGTTVVPYNLFLHATAVRKRWAGIDVGTALREARAESRLSIVIGGAVTGAMLVVASLLLSPADAESVIQALVAAVEQQLPGFGGAAVGLGLFAAGLTSAIAAPVSAGWAVCGALGWSLEHRSLPFRGVSLTVLLTGVVFAVLATRPVALILLAQATNALLLPLIAVVLLVVANQRHLLGAQRNGWLRNGLTGAVLLLVLTMAGYRLMSLIF